VPTPKRRAKGAPSGPGAKAGKKVSETIRLKASDGFELSAYVAKPSGTPKGGFVVIQEIFGVNGHIRRITDGFARDGFLAIAPALFDRIEPGIELGYSPQDIERGLQLKSKSATENALQDIEAARTAVANAGSVGVIGYCWGGSSLGSRRHVYRASRRRCRTTAGGSARLPRSSRTARC
jgi:hypothetical protein